MDQFGMGIYKDMFQRVSDRWSDLAKEYAANPFPVAKVNIYHQSADSRRRTRERILAAGLEVTMADAETTSLEISLKHVDKGTGLEKLCRHLNLPIAQTIVVGDADNDLEALKKAGLAVAMGNASPQVKAAADVVVADCDHGGCAQAVDILLKR